MICRHVPLANTDLSLQENSPPVTQSSLVCVHDPALPIPRLRDRAHVSLVERWRTSTHKCTLRSFAVG